jgi:hypothetical protein
MNLTNVLQLGVEFSGLVTLVCSGELEEVPAQFAALLRQFQA